MYVVADFLYISWGMRETGGSVRIRAIAAGIYRTYCRNKLIYGRSWDNSFPANYRSLTVQRLLQLAVEYGNGGLDSPPRGSTKRYVRDFRVEGGFQVVTCMHYEWFRASVCVWLWRCVELRSWINPKMVMHLDNTDKKQYFSICSSLCKAEPVPDYGRGLVKYVGSFLGFPLGLVQSFVSGCHADITAESTTLYWPLRGMFISRPFGDDCKLLMKGKKFHLSKIVFVYVVAVTAVRGGG